MGTPGCRSPLNIRTPPWIATLLTIGLLLLSVEAFNTNSECNLDSCWNRYSMVRTSIEQQASFDGEDSHLLTKNEQHCIALRTYRQCIKEIKDSGGCHGDLRYFSVRNVVKNNMKKHNCTNEGRMIDPSKIPPASESTPKECAYNGPKVFKQCLLFGDPHLGTFRGEFQTCKVRGAWPLVNNKYLTVQVTNDAVAGDSGATATSKLTVIVKENSRCASNTFQMYLAQTDNLPGSFYDGRTHYGPDKSVELNEIEPGKHVEIHIRYIETTIVVRQIGRYFTFAIRMPEDVVNTNVDDSGDESSDHLQLCVTGCPASERINYQEYLAQRQDRITSLTGSGSSLAMERSDAERVCREAQLVDFYFDSCVFDLMTTGDKNFSVAAVSALQDELQLDPNLARSHSNRSDLKPYDEMYGSAVVAVPPSLVTILSVVVLTLFLTMQQCQTVRISV